MDISLSVGQQLQDNGLICLEWIYRGGGGVSHNVSLLLPERKEGSQHVVVLL